MNKYFDVPHDRSVSENARVAEKLLKLEHACKSLLGTVIILFLTVLILLIKAF